MRGALGTAVIGVVVGSAVAAWAQVQPPQDRINTALDRARQVGIPIGLLERKIAEGKAKGVSLERIATVVERREALLERASQAMAGQDGVGDADLAVGADALELQVSEAMLTSVAESAPRGQRAVAIATLTELVQLGHSPGAALSRVRQAIEQGPTALLNLPAAAGRRGPPLTVPMPDAAAGRRGGSGSPPPSVPAPGGTSQPAKPVGGPATAPRGPSGGRGAGRGSA